MPLRLCSRCTACLGSKDIFAQSSYSAAGQLQVVLDMMSDMLGMM